MQKLERRHSFDPVFDSQKVYRTLLEALSYPSRRLSVVDSALQVNDNAALALAMSIVDNEVTYAVVGDAQLDKEIALYTLSESAAIEDADFIFVQDVDRCAEVIAAAKAGTLADPHKSATLIVCAPGERDCTITLQGPGIKCKQVVEVHPAVVDCLDARDAQLYEYPQGIDMVFLDQSSEIMAIPRLVGRADMNGQTPPVAATNSAQEPALQGVI